MRERAGNYGHRAGIRRGLSLGGLRRRFGVDAGGGRLHGANGFQPELIADFVNGDYRNGGEPCAFGDLFTFSRASESGFFLNRDGVMERTASGVARQQTWRMESGVMVPKGLALESDAGTNLVPESRDLDEWGGAVTNLTVSADADTAPDGTATATRLTTAVTSGASHLIREALTKAAAATDYVWSIHVKADGFGFFSTFLHGTSSSNRVELSGNLTTGAVSTASAGTGFTVHESGSEELPNGWWRFWIAFQSNADTDLGIQHYVADGLLDETLDGDGASGILSWGADLKAGRVLSSHVPTDGGTATRAAEVISIAAADLPYSATAMSIAMEGGIGYVDNGSTTEALFYNWAADADNFILAKLNTASTNTGRLDAQQEETTTNDAAVGNSQLTPGVLVPFSIAARHGATFIQLGNDGVAGTVNATPTALPDLSSSGLDLADDFNGTISRFRMWDADIGAAGIAEASA